MSVNKPALSVFGLFLLDGSGRPVARLAILPGVTHYNILSSDAVAVLVTPFLDAPMPAAK